MGKRKVKIGEIALIPVNERMFVPSKVIYVSTRYKDTILLLLYPQVVKSLEVPVDLVENAAIEVYTSQKAITSSRWASVGVQALRPCEVGKAKRIVAGDVWQDDNLIAPASEQDYEKLPEMLVLGAGLVEKKARRIAADLGFDVF